MQYAFGGVTMTAGLRTMQHFLDRPEFSLVTANAIFCAPSPCGDVTADVTILRNGRGAAQVACDLHVGESDEVALRVHGVFGTAHDFGREFTDISYPGDVKPPDACPPPPARRDERWPAINFHEQTDWRPALPQFWDEPANAETAETTATEDAQTQGDPMPRAARFASWTRLLVEPRLPDGSYDPISLAVPADSIGPAIGAKHGPSDEFWMTLSLEIGLRIIQPPSTEPAWVLQDMTAWQSGDGYATGPSFLWDADHNLLAIAQQTAHLRRGAPKTD